MRHFEDGPGELVIAGLLAAVAGGVGSLRCRIPSCSSLAARCSGSFPSFLPAELVLVVFLLPLRYGESIYAVFNELRANLRALTLRPRRS
jgi:hypothetical protein